MKKTIIAASIAAVVAAPAAFADVTISGMVNMEVQDLGRTTGYVNSVNTDLVFTASEDLGNGMKAGMKYHIFHDDGASTTQTGTDVTSLLGNNVADLTVFLAGDFGTINAGRQETVNMAYFHGFAAGDAAHDMTLEDANGQQGRLNAIAYTTPSMNGFSVTGVVGIGAGMANSGTDTSDVDATELVAKYSNGPLTVAIGSTKHKGGTANDEEVTNLAASYTMGDLKVSVLNRDVDNSDAGTANNKMTTVGLNYTMGSNAIYAGMTDSDDAQDGDYVVSFAHNLSKRTSVYVAYKNDDSGVTAAAASATANARAAQDSTNVLVGIQHKF
jgi:predicted porin